MDFSKFTFNTAYKNGHELFFDFDIKTHTGHGRSTFNDYKSLLYFLSKNKGKKLHITKNQVEDFYEDGDKLIINLAKYQEFCGGIGRNGENRAQAYFSRRIKHYSEEEKKEIITSADDQQILDWIRSLPKDKKIEFSKKLRQVEGIDLSNAELDEADFSNVLAVALTEPDKLQILTENYPKVQIQILEEYRRFLEDNLDKNETFIQNWIDGKVDNKGTTTVGSDEEVRKLKKSRCLIFGLEFIDHKREGNTSSKRFDVLTRLSEGKNEYVLIELKSPNSDVFKIIEKDNENGGKSTEYHLSDDIARAIPQIFDYRNLLENATETEWQKIGLPRGKVAKCLILIGARKKDDPVWEDHFLNLRKNLSSSIEILTYTDLIRKLDTTIRNLKNNL